ncbi:MAG: shikimate kinase [Actinomycetota bacterium]
MSNLRNIVLIGFMGAGKTQVGRRLAEVLHRPFVDTDKMVEDTAGATIETIFSTLGEDKFRELETETIKSLAHIRGEVIATGGGAISKEENAKMLKDGGFVVYLYARPNVLFERIGSGSGRPLAETKNGYADMEVLLMQRDPLYREAADMIIDTSDKTIGEVEHEIFQAIGY